MKKINILFLLVIFLSGCATYKLQRGKSPYDKGFVVAMDGRQVLEYTLGQNNSVPETYDLAQKRFERRKNMVDYYYKKMGIMENRLKMTFWDSPVAFVKLIGGVFRLPVIAVSDYRYDHNPKYRERIDKLGEEKDAREERRIKSFREALNDYIQRDLVYEGSAGEMSVADASSVSEAAVTREITKAQKAPVEALVLKGPILKEGVSKVATPESVSSTKSKQATLIPLPEVKQQVAQKPLIKKADKEPVVKKTKPRPQKKPRIDKKTAVRQKTHKAPVTSTVSGKDVLSRHVKAVVIANPAKGFSPLRVHFYGSRSSVPKGRIVSYSWDFGDGDVSNKPNPVNTYYSGSFEPQHFTVTLTVQDDKGNTAQTTTSIEVMNK